MRIYNQGVLSRFLKKFGLRDIEIGDPNFDELFIIKSNDPALAKRLLDSKTRHSIEMLYENQKTAIAETGEVPDSIKRRAANKDMKSAMKIVEFFFSPSRSTFEIKYGKRELCLEVFGLIDQVEKAQVLLDGLISLHSDWHLFRA